MKIVLSYEDEHVLSIVGNYQNIDGKIKLTGAWSIYIGNVLDMTKVRPTCLYLGRVKFEYLKEFYIKYSFDGFNYTRATLLNASGEYEVGVPIPIGVKCFAIGATYSWRSGYALIPKEVELLSIEIVGKHYTEFKFDPFKFGTSFTLSSLASYGLVKTIRG